MHFELSKQDHGTSKQRKPGKRRSYVCVGHFYITYQFPCAYTIATCIPVSLPANMQKCGSCIPVKIIARTSEQGQFSSRHAPGPVTGYNNKRRVVLTVRIPYR